MILSELEKVVGTCKYSLSRANEHQDLMQKWKEYQRPIESIILWETGEWQNNILLFTF